MANIEKPIWSVDGQTLTNVLVNNKSTTYNKVSNWYDGTPMDDSKLDDDFVYVKYEGEYLVRNMEEGQVLQKDTMDEMRNLSTFETLLLKIGIYKHVQLNGYYEKGDTPEPINYKISDTVEDDDGGSVIETHLGDKLEHDFNRYVNVLYFGLGKPGGAEVDAEFDNLLDFLNKDTSETVVYFPKGYKYRISSTKTFRTQVNIEAEASINYTGDHTEPAIVVGSPVQRNNGRSIRLGVTSTENRSTWDSGDGDKGIVLYNCYSSTIRVGASFFKTGVELIGTNGNGFVYNEITLSNFNGNHEALVLNSDNEGWCNENNFFGGRIHASGGTPSNDNRYGVVLRSGDGYRQNNNIFYKTSIELNSGGVDSPYRAIAIKIENGRQNEWVALRDETNSLTVQTFNDSHNNKIHATFSVVGASYLSRVEDLGDYPSTIFTSNQQLINNTRGWELLNITNVNDYFFESTDDGKVSVLSPLKIQSDSSSNPSSSPTDSLQLNSDTNSIELTTLAGFGVRINTQIRKRFTTSITTVDKDNLGRIYIVCRDENQEIIPDSFDLVRISGRHSKVISSRFGGGVALVFSYNIDSGNFMHFFCVDDVVKYVDIFYSGYGSTPVSLKSVNLYSIDGSTDLIPYNTNIIKTADSMPNNEVGSIGDFRIKRTGDEIGYIKKTSGWVEVGKEATTTTKGEVLMAEASDNTADPVGSEYNQNEVQGILDELRDLKSKMRSAGLLES